MAGVRGGGDLYERDYEGLYCAGCEAFVAAGDLVDGRCPEHGAPPERGRRAQLVLPAVALPATR